MILRAPAYLSSRKGYQDVQCCCWKLVAPISRSDMLQACSVGMTRNKAAHDKNVNEGERARTRAFPAGVGNNISHERMGTRLCSVVVHLTSSARGEKLPSQWPSGHSDRCLLFEPRTATTHTRVLPVDLDVYRVGES
jgi:hypothetical protein